jgi:hypothetical protein
MDQTKETAQSAQNKMGDTMQAGQNKASVSGYTKKIKNKIADDHRSCLMKCWIRPSHEE